MAKAQIINRLLENLGMNISTFEKKIGIGGSTIHKAIQRNSDLRMDTIQKIVDNFPQVNKLWLQTGEGEMFVKHSAAVVPTKEDTDTTTHNDWKQAHERLLDIHNKYADSHLVLSNALAAMTSLLKDVHDVKTNLDKAVKDQQGYQVGIAANQEIIEGALEKLLKLPEGELVQKADTLQNERLMNIAKKDSVDA